MQTLEIKDFIKTKQDSKSHTEEEINFFIKNLSQFTQDEITEWLKAVKRNGMDDKETTSLTLAMANSGTVLSWEGLEPTIDKHSTGGIGDKVTLLFAPLIAAYGINVPKLSGRSLGFSGGTIDKLESISGFKTNLSTEQIKEQVKKIGLAICSASTELAPADKKLYFIRDVTDTVDSIPLIASSIMSKKIAGGSKNIILDVKFGSGAFMKTLKEAQALARKMVTIGKNLNKNTKAVISDMNQPLGYAVGNTLEIKEVLEVLSGKEIKDLIEIVICLAKEAIAGANLKPQEGNLESKLREILLHGKALKKFEEMISAQGGNLKSIFNPEKKAKYIESLKSNCEGYIQNIDALLIGEVVHELGAGRKSVSDQIDHSVGILFHKKHGDKVVKDEPILEIHAKCKEDAEFAKRKLSSALKFGQNEPGKLKLVHEIVR
ncbi:MAG: thymidine phosphorylase [Candidatus Melainabacteria bacterium]|nr:thymidine phosphorylase [Candidatus Melainabacteria bacterium]